MKRLITAAVLLTMISCGSGDEASTPSEVLVRKLTRGASMTWKFNAIVLVNQSVPDGLDLTGMFNTVDDEIVMTFDPVSDTYAISAQWRPRFDINYQASTVQETLSETYSSTKQYRISIQDTTNQRLISANELFQMTLASDDLITGILTLDNTTHLELELTPKSSDDYKKASSMLEFREAAQFSGVGMVDAPGMTGSVLSKSVYFSHRTPNQADQVFEEVILKYDIEGRRIDRITNPGSDFVTKQLHIVGGKLQVVSGIYLSTYDVDIQENLSAISHGASLSRFGSATLNGSIYISGGDLNALDSDKIKKWNVLEKRFERIATMPSNKFLADAEIVDDKLYVFGGRNDLFEGVDSDDIFIYDLELGTFETLKLPIPVFRTYTSRYENLIFVGGQLLDDDMNTQDIDIFLGAFDTETNKFQQMETSLDDSGWFSLHQLTVVGDQLYVIYGDGINADEGVETLSIYVADL